MLSITEMEDRGIVLAEAEKLKYSAPKDPVRSQAHIRLDNSIKGVCVECGAIAEGRAKRCEPCRTERLVVARRKNESIRRGKAKKISDSLATCMVCSAKHYVIFEYAGLDMCKKCANEFIGRDRDDAMRKDNERIVNERDGTSIKIDDGQAGSEICDVHKRREAC